MKRIAVLGDQEVVEFDGSTIALDVYLSRVRPVDCTVFEHPGQTGRVNRNSNWVKLDLTYARALDFTGYDMILDGGTLEHVANMPAAFSAIWEGLAPGGLLVAGYPANNLCDHGYWQPQPRFFDDFFRANRAEAYSIQVLHGLGNIDLHALRTLDYTPIPAGQAWQPEWANADGQVGIFMMARKSNESRPASVRMPSEFSR